MTQTLYEVLGVHPSATAEEIEAASIRLGEQHHPDKNKGKLDAAIRFKQIEQAYEILSDPAKRSDYDRSISIEKDISGKPRSHRRLTRLGVFLVTLGVMFLAFTPLWHNKEGIAGAGLIALLGVAAIAVSYMRFWEEIDASVAAPKSSIFSESFTRFIIVLVGLFCGPLLASSFQLVFNSAAKFPATAPPAPSAKTPIPATAQKSAPAQSISTLDPRSVFPKGAKFESDELTKLVDKNFPNAKFRPDQTIQVEASGKTYVVRTRKLNNTGNAIYEISSVTELDSQSLPTPPARPDAKLDTATLDSCFLAGKNAATVSLVNIDRLAEVGLNLSDVMNEGCARKGRTTQNPRECIYNCELGFKATARKALK